MPWTGHLFDTAVFFRISDSVFFAHTPLTGNWSFGSLGLLAVLLSQVPVLFDPSLATVHWVRLLLLKMPSWFADLGTSAIVRYACSNPASGNYWALRYLLDPIVIFTTVFHGQWDALPNLFAVAGIALMATGKYEYSAVALGLGTGTKFYPAVFVPLLAVAAFRNRSLQAALASMAWFAATAIAALAPVFWGRMDYVLHSYAFNSFGPGQGVFTFSLWSLLPKTLGISTRIEQLAAVAVPLVLAAAELRHVPRQRDIVRTAMFSAMSIVLLNPGAHPPFYLWIAGPLVLYAATVEDGLVSAIGVVLTGASLLTQFCLEGSDEYFLMTFGVGPRAAVLRCIAPIAVLEWVILVCALLIAFAAFRRADSPARARFWRLAGQSCALLAALAFFTAAWIGVISASSQRHQPLREGDLFTALPIAPLAMPTDRGCRLIYNSFGSASFSKSSFAQPYVKTSLDYVLFSPETMVIRGRAVDVASLPSHYENREVGAYDGPPVHVTREFDITPLLRPLADYETMIERPCSLIADNPLLIYHFDLDAARAAAAREPLLQRLNVFRQETLGAER